MPEGDEASEPLERLLRSSAAVLEEAGIEARVARAEAEDLLSWSLVSCGDDEADISEVRRRELMGMSLADCEDPRVAQAALARFHRALRRRAGREPLQWIEGVAPFRGLELSVGPGVFVPRPETELVAGAGIDALKDLVARASRPARKPVIADLFAGSGAIGLAAALEVPGVRVIAVEESPRASFYLRRNAEALAVAHPWLRDDYVPLEADVFGQGTQERIHRAARSLGSPDGLLDAVLANPPYLPEDRPVEQPEAAKDPHEALYGGSGDGLAIPVRAIRLLPRLLRPGGLVVMEHDPTQQQALGVEFRRDGFVHVRGESDYSGRARWIQAELESSGTPQR